ncbi:CNNM domain-containing protein [Corynebacterium heidelbergense]|uniref:CNNM transmembrane domain-containing protein n=1 Tax=Corynebacterium heidelbergense TaxID=2055947 RepID=A0A364V8B0_9CORY|nr:CNNM domain-containing protein [Corynebacterium heidelbergense]RAV32885.1 hypothetical protein CWC39_10125 [Corynebacterium heidelbergense]WCZ37562.1 CBS domain protein [Corynebacterium heidelbergense]
MNPSLALLLTIVFIIGSAFFVVLEFSLLGARRNRLEMDAENSRAARAALRGVNELTIMLAGSQLGITACTFALGAITEPAVHHLLEKPIHAVGLPEGVTSAVSFVLALLFVTFLHLVVGEMAPKSWAITHPERSAKLVALPSRAFIWLTRPILVFVNFLANRMVKASGVEPVDRAAVGGRDIDTIRQLVELSASAGSITHDIEEQITGLVDLQRIKIAELVQEAKQPVVVPGDATCGAVRKASAEHNSKRLLVLQRTGGKAAPAKTQVPTGVVHVRDTFNEDLAAPVAPHVRPVLTLDADKLVYEALTTMRDRSEHIAVVTRGKEFVGAITLSSIVTTLLPSGEAAQELRARVSGAQARDRGAVREGGHASSAAAGARTTEGQK